MIDIVSVNVGTPAVIWPDPEVVSGIVKTPVRHEHVWLRATNLDGDGQADTRIHSLGEQVHGGTHKAVYAYPTEHFPSWSEILGEAIGPAAFGENLTIAGATEADVCIGDVWRWGTALLQVSEPREPCFKLDMLRKTKVAAKTMRERGWTGWYHRVLEPGRVPTHGQIAVVAPHPARVSVLEVHRAIVDQPDTVPWPDDLPLTPGLLRWLKYRETAADRGEQTDV